MNKLHVLANRYRDCRSLFVTQLGLKNATVGDVVDELVALPISAPLSTRKDLLKALNEYLQHGSGLSKNSIHLLKANRVIPVRDIADGGGKLRVMSYSRSRWYFADRQSLRDCFEGKVPLVDFTIDEVRGMSALIKEVGLEKRLLSEAHVETTEIVGDPIRDPKRTSDLRERAEYLLR